MSIEKIDIDKCICCVTCIATCHMDVLRMDRDTNSSKINYQ